MASFKECKVMANKAFDKIISEAERTRFVDEIFKGINPESLDYKNITQAIDELAIRIVKEAETLDKAGLLTAKNYDELSKVASLKLLKQLDTYNASLTMSRDFIKNAGGDNMTKAKSKKAIRHIRERIIQAESIAKNRCLL